MQLTIFDVHTRESNLESQTFLEANRKRLSGNCQKLFDRMMAGERLTSFNCGLVDFRRRICDLKENGVQLHYEKEKQMRCKIWYMLPEQIIFNKKFVVSK